MDKGDAMPAYRLLFIRQNALVPQTARHLCVQFGLCFYKLKPAVSRWALAISSW